MFETISDYNTFFNFEDEITLLDLNIINSIIEKHILKKIIYAQFDEIQNYNKKIIFKPKKIPKLKLQQFNDYLYFYITTQLQIHSFQDFKTKIK